MKCVSRLPVSIVMSMRNSSSTIIPCLEGLASQAYPISEIIVIDNVSSDDCADKVETFAKQCPIPVRLIRQTVDGGIGNSYNSGAAMARSPLLILVHSDGGFPSTHEVEKLAAPLCEDPDVVAAYPKLLMPRDVWERFPYWQKCLFARAVDMERPSMCGKFDCIRRDVFLRVGGYDTKRFTATCGYGGEDADAHSRIARAGRIAQSEARVIHLHNLSENYGLRALFVTRKLLARTYSKVLRFQGVSPTFGKLLFFVRPALAVIPLIPHLFGLGGALLFAFSLANSWRMYTTRTTLLNPRILLLPFVDVALVYYETFWFIEGLLTPPADAARAK
ncbi:MAG TPA: glycosyltransferase family 2 protein [Kiritimatiellia bacterium]|nr:glycosyltransferase family 2 protein [Kiritimatiellia bacterium]HPS07023.1 glycosyltransferase family 2 protein [Kiritimatiellia bacterium]